MSTEMDHWWIVQTNKGLAQKIGTRSIVLPPLTSPWKYKDKTTLSGYIDICTYIYIGLLSFSGEIRAMPDCHYRRFSPWPPRCAKHAFSWSDWEMLNCRPHKTALLLFFLAFFSPSAPAVPGGIFHCSFCRCVLLRKCWGGSHNEEPY